jgi:hypothetical protein
MSGKTGKRVTGRKPESTRRHDSLTPGAFGNSDRSGNRSGLDLNIKRSGEPSKQHSKYKTAKAAG